MPSFCFYRRISTETWTQSRQWSPVCALTFQRCFLPNDAVKWVSLACRHHNIATCMRAKHLVTLRSSVCRRKFNWHLITTVNVQMVHRIKFESKWGEFNSSIRLNSLKKRTCNLNKRALHVGLPVIQKFLQLRICQRFCQSTIHIS